MLKKILKTLFVFALFLPYAAFGQQNSPNPSGYVNDFAGILTNSDTLEQELAQFDAETSNQIAVVTIPSLDGTPIEEYAVQLFEKWRIGQKTKDNGVLLLVAPNEKEVRIEVGYGLEGALPDITASAIIRNDILPHFKTNDFDAGVSAGVLAIMRAVQGEYSGESAQSTATAQAIRVLPTLIFWIIIILLVIFSSKGKKNGFLWFLLGMMLGDRGPRGRGGSSGGSGGFGGGSSGGGGASGRW
jgi:uncharacterized protein